MGEQIEIPFENKFIWKVGDLVPTVDQTLNYWPIAFCVEGKWIMRITADYHIEFNREEFPNLTMDEFAGQVVKILESMIVKVEKKIPFNSDEYAERNRQ